MRAIDWLFVIGIVALVIGPILSLRLIAKNDAKYKRKLPPKTENKADDDESDW